jgi:transcription elongation factor Elf1
MEGLVHLRYEAYITEHVATVDTYSQIVPVFAYLRQRRQGEQHEQTDDAKD